MKEVEIPDNIWEHLVSKGKEIEHGITNSFDDDDIQTILSTMDFFNATNVWLTQSHYDLTIPRYRLFDWLAMCVMGRNDDDTIQNTTALKVLLHSWLKTNGDPKLFIQDLRETDYEINTSWECITL